jgi:ribose/xylose/arabinose/galactoside ABC-type transport system permease subunit
MSRAAPAWWRSPVVAFLLDAVLVIAFAVIGRRSHTESLTVAGILATASPFLVGAAVGWLVVRLRSHTWPLDVGPGVTVWFCTVVVGMLLRVIVLRSFAWPFLAVAAGVLALTLVGWRLLATRLGTRSTHA